jgi:DNA-binding MarR family transcriptional regulator
MCDRLVQRGLIRREAAPENRREVRLSLTAPGRQLVDRTTRSRRRDLQRVLAAMPEADRHRLVPALEAFTDATTRTLDVTWPGAHVLGEGLDE